MSDFSIYRRQYMVGPRPAGIAEWRTVVLGGEQVASVHPELPCTEVSDEARRLICLGDMLSPDEPHADNHAILKELFRTFSDFETLERATAALGGRWLLLARHGTRLRAYPDALGGRPIYHISDASGVWLASLPGLLARILESPPDVSANAEFARYERDDWWPGTLTPFKAIKRSLPNHYLDLADGAAVRFWPRQPIPPADVDFAASEIRRTLAGIVSAAAHRYDVHLALTGGYDSRVVLAAAAPAQERLRGFTLDYPGIQPFDLSIPERLARRCGLPYTRERYEAPPDDFLTRFDALASGMVSGQCRLNAFSYRRFPSTVLFAEGTGGEMLRCAYHPEQSGATVVTAAELATRSGFAGNPMAVAEFAAWLDRLPNTAGAALWDLFYWEQRMGSWNATDYATQELTRAVFTPFSCRRILEAGLGTPVATRRAPYGLFHTVCRQARPEVLRERFNHTLSTELRQAGRKIIGEAKRLLGGDA